MWGIRNSWRMCTWGTYSKKVYNLWRAKETAGECVPGGHEKVYNLCRAEETAGECVPGEHKKVYNLCRA